MKKTKILIGTVFMLIFALMMSACSLSIGEKDAEPVRTEAPAAAETPAPAESASPQLCDDEPALAVEFAGQTDGLEGFTDAEGEYANSVLFTAGRDIKELRYLEVSAQLSESGEVSIAEKAVLYTLDSVDSGEKFVISMALEGYVPDRAISYVDGCGATHYFYVTISGEDNVPLLNACLPE